MERTLPAPAKVAAARPDFGWLPDDAIGDILAFCHLISRLKLEQTCRRAKKYLLAHASFWTDLSFRAPSWKFHELFSAAARRLRDEQLSALLIRCEASSRVVSLSITGCVSLTGIGLLPLRGTV